MTVKQERCVLFSVFREYTVDMKLREQQTGSSNAIRAYEPGMVRINETVCTCSLIVTPQRLVDDWPVTHVGQVDSDVLLALLDYGPEIILLGVGNRQHILDPRVTMPVMQRGVGIEIMTTDAACRTYNVLLGEDRKVLAALIVEPPVDT